MSDDLVTRLEYYQSVLDGQTKRIDLLAADVGKLGDLEPRVIRIEEQITTLQKSLDRLVKHLEEGNGYQGRLIRVETGLVNLAQNVQGCQARARTWWKLLLGTGLAVAGGVAVYLIQLVIGGSS